MKIKNLKILFLVSLLAISVASTTACNHSNDPDEVGIQTTNSSEADSEDDGTGEVTAYQFYLITDDRLQDASLSELLNGEDADGNPIDGITDAELQELKNNAVTFVGYINEAGETVIAEGIDENQFTVVEERTDGTILLNFGDDDNPQYVLAQRNSRGELIVVQQDNNAIMGDEIGTARLEKTTTTNTTSTSKSDSSSDSARQSGMKFTFVDEDGNPTAIPQPTVNNYNGGTSTGSGDSGGSGSASGSSGTDSVSNDSNNSNSNSSSKSDKNGNSTSNKSDKTNASASTDGSSGSSDEKQPSASVQNGSSGNGSTVAASTNSSGSSSTNNNNKSSASGSTGSGSTKTNSKTNTTNNASTDSTSDGHDHNWQAVTERVAVDGETGYYADSYGYRLSPLGLKSDLSEYAKVHTSLNIQTTICNKCGKTIYDLGYYDSLEGTDKADTVKAVVTDSTKKKAFKDHTSSCDGNLGTGTSDITQEVIYEDYNATWVRLGTVIYTDKITGYKCSVCGKISSVD
jgi:hypothetical protein